MWPGRGGWATGLGIRPGAERGSRQGVQLKVERGACDPLTRVLEAGGCRLCAHGDNPCGFLRPQSSGHLGVCLAARP